MQVIVHFDTEGESAGQPCRREPYHHDFVSWRTSCLPHAHQPSLKSAVRHNQSRVAARSANIVRQSTTGLCPTRSIPKIIAAVGLFRISDRHPRSCPSTRPAATRSLRWTYLVDQHHVSFTQVRGRATCRRPRRDGAALRHRARPLVRPWVPFRLVA